MIQYLFARVRLPHQTHNLVYDDTESQTDALHSQIDAFRSKANWVLILGTIALIVWISGRVVIGMWQTRRRTHRVMAEMLEDDVDLEFELTGAFGANVGPGAFLWVLFVLLTLVGFSIGLILLLTYM